MSADQVSKFSFRAIEVFITIVEEGAITAAARRLDASPSAISLQLSNLESALGTRLIERSSQRFALTDAGELFHPRAIKIMDEVTSARAVLSKSEKSPRIVLKLAIIEDFDNVVLPCWLKATANEFPNIKFKVRSGPSHENHAALDNRSADMIVAVDSVDAAEWVDEYPILNDPYVLVKSAKLRNTKAIGDLIKHPFVRYSRDQLMGRQIEAHLRRNKTIPPKNHEFTSNQAVFSMVDAMNGWTITSVTALAGAMFTANGGFRDDSYIVSPLPLPAFNRRISLSLRRDALGELPPVFVAHLREVLQENLVVPVQEAFPNLDVTQELAVLN